jgi:hypothetical protein
MAGVTALTIDDAASTELTLAIVDTSTEEFKVLIISAAGCTAVIFVEDAVSVIEETVSEVDTGLENVLITLREDEFFNDVTTIFPVDSLAVDMALVAEDAVSAIEETVSEVDTGLEIFAELLADCKERLVVLDAAIIAALPAAAPPLAPPKKYQ